MENTNVEIENYSYFQLSGGYISSYCVEEVAQVFNQIPASIFKTIHIYFNSSEFIIAGFSENETFVFYSSRTHWYEFNISEDLEYYEIVIDTQLIQNDFNSINQFNKVTFSFSNRDIIENKPIKFIDCVLSEVKTGNQMEFRINEVPIKPKEKSEWENIRSIYIDHISKEYSRKYSVDSKSMLKNLTCIRKKHPSVQFPWIYPDKLSMKMTGSVKKRKSTSSSVNLSFHLPAINKYTESITNPKLKNIHIDSDLCWNAETLFKYFKHLESKECCIYFFQTFIIIFNQTTLGLGLLIHQNLSTSS